MKLIKKLSIPQLVLILVYLLIIITAITGTLAYKQGVKQTNAKLQQTLDVCNQSHQVRSGRLENLCGRLQDETRTDYVCPRYEPCTLRWHNYQY